MGLAISEAHRELAAVSRRYLEKHESLAREVTEGPGGGIQALWRGVAAQGWTGLHLPEDLGGTGFGLSESSIVLSELGRIVAPVPVAATVAVSAMLSACGDDGQRGHHLPGLADGSSSAAVTLARDFTIERGPSRTLSGRTSAVIGATTATLIAVVVDDDVVLVDPGRAEIATAAIDPLDHTLGLAELRLDELPIGAADVVPGAASTLRALTLAAYACDAAGNAEATLEAAVAHATSRRQFGRAIGSFQAIKHHCANMAVHSELATAAAWDACRTGVSDPGFETAATMAAAVALQAARHNAQLNIQIHGGMGFTWEHDAHLFLRRAVALSQLLGPLAVLHDDAFRGARGGLTRRYGVDLPPEAERYRDEVRDFAVRYRAADGAAARTLAARSGYLVPHWPKPYGRDAGAAEQLVIDEELADLSLPNLGIGGWILQTVLQHGTPDQVDRWLWPGLLGEQQWCQLFSEPEAGSDAAGIRTRAQRADGGWVISGLKTWTSGAREAHRGLATVRTDPAAAKRDGITTVVIDMQAPGVTVRPLRELTGLALFNEVFLDEVFVPDGDVLGPVGGGWTVARATLGNERVTIGGGAHRGIGATDLVELVSATEYADDAGMHRRIGALLAEEHAMHLLGLRRVARALADAERGNEGNIAKLLSAEHAQRVTELAVEFGGAAVVTGASPRITHEYLFDRCLTIGGGTSEISRTVIAERLLGLPRDGAEA